MTDNKRSVTILIADDDEEDQIFTKEALEDYRVINDIRFVSDGQELMEYLLRQKNYADPATSPRPGLILLDLNMPRKDGRQALEEIKSHPELRRIPVVILTTSDSEEDILRSYSIGANSFVRKPVTFDGLVEAMRTIQMYWVDFVELPS